MSREIFWCSFEVVVLEFEVGTSFVRRRRRIGVGVWCEEEVSARRWRRSFGCGILRSAGACVLRCWRRGFLNFEGPRSRVSGCAGVGSFQNELGDAVLCSVGVVSSVGCSWSGSAVTV